ncbi:hypothetical protein PVK06_031587 [Gossypium arboreum]|uniref:Uncharacterized protein n=1 Tax=Gossypium arboreum TaxID=29729 RepID=A0ABR0NRI3_GOSAR|nr:hypothetical protein PVK06_031587 [Gossypium arboreum]
MSFTPPPPPVFAVENDIEPLPLKANPTIAQIRQHAEESTKKHKALDCLQNGVTDVIFTRIIACSTPKEAWETLKEEFMGSDKTRQQQVINLRRDFENLKMKELESIKQYLDRIMATVNSIRLLGEDFSDNRVVKKRRANRQEEHPEGAFQANAKDGPDIQCRSCKQFVHVEKVCKNKAKAPAQQQIQAQAAEDLQAQKEHIFTATSLATRSKVKCNWLVDSGCTHHIAADESLFKDLDRSYA